MNSIILSICVVTMNRANQLKEALESCLSCKLPEKTEFVIVDNASTDDTEDIVHTTLATCGYSYYYEKLDENLGVGGGRNYAYEKTNGQYVYMLDDDAVISPEHTDRFFLDAVNIFEHHAEVVTLTTQIYDTAWKDNRVSTDLPKFFDRIYMCKMFCGGSHFLRKSFFVDQPYLPNKYGYEEIPSSLRVMDDNKINAFCPDLLIIHKPMVNKWDRNDAKNENLIIKTVALPYAIKKMSYPIIFTPILRMGYQKRCKKYLGNFSNGKKAADDIVKETIRQYNFGKRIKIKTVLRMYKNFGISIF